MLLYRLAGDSAREQELRDKVVRLEACVTPVGGGSAPSPGLAEDGSRDVERGREHRRRLADHMGYVNPWAVS
jgi:hypothetical protein